MTLKEAWECIVETMNNNKTTQVVIVSKGDPDYDKCLSLDWLVENSRTQSTIPVAVLVFRKRRLTIWQMRCFRR